VINLMALQGIKVIDLSRILAGPLCAMMLGDSGASVIKVEQPGTGDPTRQWGPPFLGSESVYFLGINRNKRSIALDLDSEEGVNAVRRMVKDADVLVENFGNRKMNQFGLSFEQLRDINPHLIFASISGYGDSGPKANRPGYDVVAAAEGGLLSFTGEAGGGPVKIGVAMTDVCTGISLYGAIVSALFARERDPSRLGQKVCGSLLETQVATLMNIGMNYLNADILPQRHGSAHESIVPYQAFETKDHRYLVVGGATNAQFQRLCEAIGCSHLLQDSRFSINALRVRNREVLLSELKNVFASETLKYWKDKLESCNFPSGPVATLDEVFSDPQVLHRNMIEEIEHPTAGLVKVLGFAIKYSSTPCTVRLPPPLLGQHTREILLEHEFEEHEIREIISKHVIGS